MTTSLLNDTAWRAGILQSLLVEQVADAMMRTETELAGSLMAPPPQAADVRSRAQVAVMRRLAELSHDHQMELPAELAGPRWMMPSTGSWDDIGPADPSDSTLGLSLDEDNYPAVLVVPLVYRASATIRRPQSKGGE